MESSALLNPGSSLMSELIIWVFGEFCISLHISFLVKSPQTLSCFIKQLIHSQHTLQVTICPVSDPALFKVNTPLWAAVGTSSMKAQQAPECVGAHQWTLGHSKEPAVCWWSNHPLGSWLLGEGSAPQCYRQPEWCWNAGKLHFCLWVMILFLWGLFVSGSL